MYVRRRARGGFSRVGGEISRGIWGRWIWMGSLLSESTADREVNSSWPREGRWGVGGGGICLMHAPAHIWGSNSLSFSPFHSFLITKSCLSLFCCCSLLDHLVDLDEVGCLQIRIMAQYLQASYFEDFIKEEHEICTVKGIRSVVYSNHTCPPLFESHFQGLSSCPFPSWH